MSTKNLNRRLDRLEKTSNSGEGNLIFYLNEARCRVECGESLKQTPEHWQSRIVSLEQSVRSNLSTKDRVLAERLLNASKRMLAHSC